MRYNGNSTVSARCQAHRNEKNDSLFSCDPINFRVASTSFTLGHIILGYPIPSELGSQAGSSLGSTSVGDHEGRPGAERFVSFFVCLVALPALLSFFYSAPPACVVASPRAVPAHVAASLCFQEFKVTTAHKQKLVCACALLLFLLSVC